MKIKLGAADLIMNLIANMDTWNPLERLPRLRGRVPSEGLIENVDAVLQNIPTVPINETTNDKLATATVILQMLGYKFCVSRKG